jgi:cyanophycinase
VAQNPRALGIGIDENTAIVVRDAKTFAVIGAGAVYVIDGRPITYTNISEQDTNKTMSVFDVRLHLLAAGDCYDLVQRRPAQVSGKTDTKEAQPEGARAKS